MSQRSDRPPSNPSSNYSIPRANSAPSHPIPYSISSSVPEGTPNTGAASFVSPVSRPELFSENRFYAPRSDPNSSHSMQRENSAAASPSMDLNQVVGRSVAN